LAAGTFGAGVANAEDEKHWYFEVQNDSNGTVLEFRTQEEGEWSENWLSNRMEPGDKTKLDFETDEASARCARRSIWPTAATSTHPSTTARPRRSSFRTTR
jgi:hypothetical protein